MNEDARSMFSAFAQAELAGALAFAAALGRYVELTFGYGENFANRLLDVARDFRKATDEPMGPGVRSSDGRTSRLCA